MRQSGLSKSKSPHPYNTNMPSLSWGKVVARNSDNTVDVAMQNGSTFQHVQVCSNVLGSQVGSAYLPTHSLTNPVQTSSGTWDTPIASTKGDLFCVVGFLDGSSRQPKVLGFFNPSQSEMSFKNLGLAVNRHESGIYNVKLPESTHDETHYPDGSYIVVGDTTSHDMTTENSAWSPKTQSVAVPMTINHSSGTIIEIDTTGKVTINSVNGIVFNTLTVGSGGHDVALSDLVQNAFNGHVHVSATAGSNTSTPTSSMSGVGSSILTTS